MHNRRGWTTEARVHVFAILLGLTGPELQELDELAIAAGVRARLEDALHDPHDVDLVELAELVEQLRSEAREPGRDRVPAERSEGPTHPGAPAPATATDTVPSSLAGEHERHPSPAPST